MPQMYNLILFIICNRVVYIIIINLNTQNLIKRIKGIYRIGPHNKEILSIIYGSMLGNAHAEKRCLGTRIYFYQEDTHLKYLLYLHNLLSNAGYCNNQLPMLRRRLGIKGKLRKFGIFHT
jgi:LAGLIDADG DNA endonuclease family